MGLSTKQVSRVDQITEWGKTTVQPGAPELTKPPPLIRRQQSLLAQSEPLKCPRCGSTNTKFCYYNNYNKSQPRHFCKSCKRHWTKGGTLRNVPVGGGRKNKRPKISNATTTNTTTTDRPNRPLSAHNGNQKTMSNILYQAMIGSSSPLLMYEKSGNMNNSNGENMVDSTCLNISGHQNANPEIFQFSSLSTLDMINPISYQSLNAFDNYIGNLDSIEESTITSVNNIASSSSVPWPGLNTTGSLELPTYWNWNEIDVLTSSDHLNISWDDDDHGIGDIKP